MQFTTPPTADADIIDSHLPVSLRRSANTPEGEAERTLYEGAIALTSYALSTSQRPLSRAGIRLGGGSVVDRRYCKLIGSTHAFLGLATLLGLFATACSPDYPNCDTDEDCKVGEFCVDALCQQCRSDVDCPEGQACNAGACEAIAGWCGSNADCPSGEDCVSNRCIVVVEQTEPPPLETPMEQCSLQSVYFAFDSSTLEDSARDQLANNASCIRERSLPSVHITGMTDPRGTEEYNMALGERRAQSAMKYLQSLGVESELSYSSMGEEMATGTDEAGWSRDRRVEISER